MEFGCFFEFADPIFYFHCDNSFYFMRRIWRYLYSDVFKIGPSYFLFLMASTLDRVGAPDHGLPGAAASWGSERRRGGGPRGASELEGGPAAGTDRRRWIRLEAFGPIGGDGPILFFFSSYSIFCGFINKQMIEGVGCYHAITDI